VSHKQQLPSPITHQATEDSSELFKETTATPPAGLSEEVTPRKTDEAYGFSQVLSSPPQDTQPLSQYVDRHPGLSEEVEDEVKEGVWGYLVPLDPRYGDKPVVLKKRTACPLPDSTKAAANSKANTNGGKPAPLAEGEAYNQAKIQGVASGGYLIGRHPECGKLRSAPGLCRQPLTYRRHRRRRRRRFQPPLPPFHRKQGHRCCCHRRGPLEQWYLHQRGLCWT
jgi:serine/threonine-protein kinase Chk2